MLNLTRDELKQVIKDAIKEALSEVGAAQAHLRGASGNSVMLTVEQMAAIQQCCTETIRKQLKAGMIPGARRRGRRWLIPKQKYEKHLGYAPGTMPVPEIERR